MHQSPNPWITAPATGPDAPDTAMPVRHTPAPRIAVPLAGMVEPDAADRLGCRTVTGTATLWVTGVHGGAGESRLAAVLDGARPTGHAWPVPEEGLATPAVLLVCRTDMRGLAAARNALIQWAAGAVPAVDLLGLAVLADAPGKLPKPLKEFLSLVGGGAPRLWLLPWVEAWRHGETTTVPQGSHYRHLAADLAALTT